MRRASAAASISTSEDDVVLPESDDDDDKLSLLFLFLFLRLRFFFGFGVDINLPLSRFFLRVAATRFGYLIISFVSRFFRFSRHRRSRSHLAASVLYSPERLRTSSRSLDRGRTILFSIFYFKTICRWHLFTFIRSQLFSVNDILNNVSTTDWFSRALGTFLS